MTTNPPPLLASTGVEGLDDVLSGGLAPNRLYLIEGEPGSGKTTLAFQFLLEGARRGERVLYVTLSETEEESRAVAASHGWSLDGVLIYELTPMETSLEPDAQYSVFHPSEVELGDTTKRILAYVDEVKPSRIVFDSLSELRLLAGSALRYRRQILALKHYFAGRKCTVLMLDDRTTEEHDLQVRSIAHGAISLAHDAPAYGSLRRRLQVVKYRGMRYRSGHHDYEIVRGGLAVFPRLVAAEHRQHIKPERIGSGVRELDDLLGGGPERGTSTLFSGAPGTGKSTLAAVYATAAAERGEHAAFFIFDESLNTLLTRTDGMQIDLRRHIEAGRVSVRQVDPAELSPGELAHEIRRAVERDNSRIVVIDSLNGYLNSMPEEHFLTIQLHEILTYLGQRDVATLLITAHHGVIGPMTAPVDTSYLADAIVLLRYYEMDGEVRQAISVVKKRGGHHERSIRDFRLTGDGIRVGEPLSEFRGVLTGVPERRPKA